MYLELINFSPMSLEMACLLRYSNAISFAFLNVRFYESGSYATVSVPLENERDIVVVGSRYGALRVFFFRTSVALLLFHGFESGNLCIMGPSVLPGLRRQCSVLLVSSSR